jgi:hypothetical protein
MVTDRSILARRVDMTLRRREDRLRNESGQDRVVIGGMGNLLNTARVGLLQANFRPVISFTNFPTRSNEP